MKNKENLKKLSEYLKSGNLKASFDMERFTEGSLYKNTPKTECGSVGCCVGHGPFAGIPKSKDEDWFEYSERVFVKNTKHWKWCFSSDWTDIDNTPEGAAKRIDYFIEKGLPKNWQKLMWDKEKYDKFISKIK